MKPYLPLEGQLISLQQLLLRAARAFLDPGLQAGTISREQALQLLRHDVVLSSALAEQELERYTFLDPGQAACYFCGCPRPGRGSGASLLSRGCGKVGAGRDGTTGACVMGGAKRYELVSAATVGELSEKVNELMAEGWTVHGSPVTHSRQLVQAMVLTGKGGERIRRTSED